MHQKHQSHTTGKLLLCFASFLLLLFSAVAFHTSLFRSLTPSLPSVAAPADSATACALPREETQEEPAPSETSLPDTAEESSAKTRRAGVTNFLIAGKDRHSGLSDLLMVLSLDEKNRTASFVQIPRDTYASYTSGSYRKLNGAASALGGMEGLCGFLAANLGTAIDHYVILDLDCVAAVVDAIGGVTLTVPADMDYDDAGQNLAIHLKAGRQTLDGKTAEQFIRFRAGYVRADLGRLDAQKVFLSAMLDKVRSDLTLPQMVGIIRALYGKIETDLSFLSCVRYAAVGMKIGSSDIRMATLPGEATRTGVTTGAWYYVLSRAGAHKMVNELLNAYEEPVFEAEFDPNRIFTNPSYPHFEAIYGDSRKTGSTYTGDSAEEHYARLPRVGQ